MFCITTSGLQMRAPTPIVPVPPVLQSWFTINNLPMTTDDGQFLQFLTP